MRSALHVAKACLVGCHATFVTLSRCVPEAVRFVKIIVGFEKSLNIIKFNRNISKKG